MQLDIDMAEGLQACSEAAPRPPDTLGDSADAPMRASEQGDDAIGLTQPLGPQDDSLVTVRRHRPILAGLEAQAAQLTRVALPVLGTLTRKSRNTGVPSSASIPRRDFVPTSFRREPPLPMTIAF